MNKLLEQVKKLEGHDVFGFWDNDMDGACPCFGGSKKVESGTIHVEGRCWRVSKNAQDLHVWGTADPKLIAEVAKETKRALDETEWYNEYTIMGKPRWAK